MSTLDISFNNGDLLIFSDVSVNGIFSASGTSSGKDNSGMTGEIRLWSTNTPPTSWLLCDGTSYNITTYQNLYNVISTNYGGDGTTFKVPDFRRRIPIGNDSTNTTYGSNSMNSTDGRVALNMNLTQGPPYYNQNNIGKQNIDLNYIITHKHNIQSHAHDMSHNHNVNSDFSNHTHDISHNHIINSDINVFHNHGLDEHTHEGGGNHQHPIAEHSHEVTFNGNSNDVNQMARVNIQSEDNEIREGGEQRNIHHEAGTDSVDVLAPPFITKYPSEPDALFTFTVPFNVTPLAPPGTTEPKETFPLFKSLTNCSLFFIWLKIF